MPTKHRYITCIVKGVFDMTYVIKTEYGQYVGKNDEYVDDINDARIYHNREFAVMDIDQSGEVEKVVEVKLVSVVVEV